MKPSRIELMKWPMSWLNFPAIVVGKGPTVDRLGEVKLQNYRIFTLNHAIRAVEPARVDGAHFVDIEAYVDCEAEIARTASYVFMPDRPHEKMTQGRPIEEQLKEHSSLRSLSDMGRLVVYRKEAAHAKGVGNDPKRVSCLYFSAEALFGVLGIAGFKEVHTIGVDGGASYGKTFSGLTPLTNGRKTFDDQMGELTNIAAVRNFKWTRLFSEAAHA